MSTTPTQNSFSLGGRKRAQTPAHLSKIKSAGCTAAKRGQGRDLVNSTKDSLDRTGAMQYCEAPKGFHLSCLLMSVIPNGYTKRPKSAPFSSPPPLASLAVAAPSSKQCSPKFKIFLACDAQNHDTMCLQQAFSGNFKITLVRVQGWRMLQKTVSNGV